MYAYIFKPTFGVCWQEGKLYYEVSTCPKMLALVSVWVGGESEEEREREREKERERERARACVRACVLFCFPYEKIEHKRFA